jgi:hypothetical protein
MVLMKTVNAFRRFALSRVKFQVIAYMNALEYQNLAVQLNFAICLRGELAFASRDSARFQRAAKGAGKSARGCGDDVIERRGVRRVNCHVSPVMLRHLRMNAKENRVGLDR